MIEIQNTTPSDLASMVYKFFDKKKTSGGTIKKEIISNKEMAEELHKAIIRKFKARKIYSLFIYTLLGVLILLICS